MKRIPAAGLVGLALREAVATEYRAVVDLVRQAIADTIYPGRPDAGYVVLEGIYPDRVVVAREGRLYAYPYTLAEDNRVVLGEPAEVVLDHKPVMSQPLAVGTVSRAETLREAVFIEAVGEADSGKWLIRVMRAGLSANGNLYQDAVLREAAPLFEGARVFEKTDEQHIKGQGKAFGQLIGGLSGVKFVEGSSPDTGEIHALFTLIEPAGAVATKLREAQVRGLAGLFGFSIDADGTAKTQLREGRKVRVATSITRVNSVDLIVEPAAGGELIRMVESVNPQEDRDMSLRQKMLDTIKDKAPAAYVKLNPETATDDDLEVAYREAVNTRGAEGSASTGGVEERIRMVEARADMRAKVAGCNLPDAAKDRIRADFERRERFVDVDVTTAIEAERSYLAKFAESGKVELGEFDSGARAEDRSAKMAAMLDAFFDPQHKDHKAVGSFRECYIEFTGDRQVTGQLRDCDRARLRESRGAHFVEALDTTSWADALGDSITRRMQGVYEGQTDLQAWRRVVTVGRANDFRAQERVRIGGYGNLPAVAQGADYTALTSPGDDKASFAVSKRGGLETVTLEMIKNDDVNAIRRVPVELALSAGNTLYEFVFDFFRTNPAIYDTKALYHVDHGNLFTAALDATAFAAHRLAMVKQARAGSAKRLGTTPAIVLVPFELEETAYNLFQRNTNLDQTFVQSMKPQVIVPSYWTDANDWCAVADPMKLPVLEVSFLDGQEQPELFVQDQPNVGSLFTADKITYKIRHIYGGVVLVDGEKGTTKAVVV